MSDKNNKSRGQNLDQNSNAKNSAPSQAKLPNRGKSAAEPDDTIEIATPGGALGETYSQNSPSDTAATSRSVPNENPQAPGSLANSSGAKALQTPSSENPKLDNTVKRLSSEQVQHIASKFNTDHEVASENEREQLLKSLGSETEAPQKAPVVNQAQLSSAPLVSRKSPRASKAPQSTSHDSQSSVISHGPARGVARFSGRTITLEAAERMQAGDDLVVSGNHYQLQPGKGSSSAFAYIAALVLVVVSAFAGKHFLADNQPTGGEIIGVALDQNGIPYSEGAVVRLPDLGVSTVTNSQGLFRFLDIPDGSYKIEYNLAGNLGGSQIVSITDNESRMVALDGATKRLAQTLIRSSKKGSTSPKRVKLAAAAKPRVSQSSNSAVGAKGALAVTSDITDAVVYVDDQKLGHVNRTFRRMNTGERTIRIEKTGYRTYETKVTIKSNKIAKVNATLVPIRAQETPTPAPELSAADHFRQGQAAFESNDRVHALEQLNLAIDKDPSFAEAYFLRAQMFADANKTESAYLDYIRAGEIWSLQKRNGEALAAFDNAVEVSGGQALTYKVRGDFFANQKNLPRGIEDYQKAISADKNYYEAHLALGIALFESGSYRHADKKLRRARDFNDKDPVLYQYLMLNSLAKNNLSDVNRYFKQFKKKATPAEMARFKSSNKLAAVRRIVRD